MHKGSVHADRQCIGGGVHAERRSPYGCGLDPARAPDAEVAVKLGTVDIGDEHVYRDASVAWQERVSLNLPSTISTHISIPQPFGGGVTKQNE